MKKTQKTRLVALILAVLMGIATLAGCTANSQDQELKELYGIETNTTTNTTEIDQASSCEELENLQNQIDSLTETVETLIDKMGEDATNSAKALQEAKSEIENLKKENEELKAQVVPAVEVIDGAVYCDIDYFLERTTVVFDDSTAALLAITEGEEVILDDIHAVDTRGNYRAKLVTLPLKDNKLAITFDGTEVLNAVFGTKTVVYSSKTESGYELVEVAKEEWDEELQLVAVCVPNEKSEYGYDFYVVAKEYVKHTTVKPTPQKEEEKKPTVIPLPTQKPENDEDDNNEETPVITPTPTPEVQEPAHNDRPVDQPNDGDSTQNPESDGTEVEKPQQEPVHNERPGQVETDGDSTQQPESDGTVVELPAHNDRPTSNKTKTTENTSAPAHSDRP